MQKRQKIYKAGQKRPGGKFVDKVSRQGAIAKHHRGKTHSVKGLRKNHNVRSW